MFWICRLWQGNRSQLQNITNAQLGSRNAVFRCQFCDNRIFQSFPVCNRRISFYLNLFMLAEIQQCRIGFADMQQNLVYHRLYPTILHQTFQIVYQKVGNANHPHFACCLCIFQGTPNFPILCKIPLFSTKFLPRLRRMNNHLIQIIQTHFLQGFID